MHYVAFVELCPPQYFEWVNSQMQVGVHTKALGYSVLSKEVITGPVQLAFPCWALHSGWQATHSPSGPANSRGALGERYSKNTPLDKMNIFNTRASGTRISTHIYWPSVKITAAHTCAISAVVPTGETLVRPRAPATRVRTQCVTHMAFCNCTHNKVQ